MSHPVPQPQCPSCSQPIMLHDPLTRCAHCGQPFDAEKLLRPLLVGRNIEYYEREFSRMEAEKKYASWNRAAFWNGASWLFYRKMYGYGFLYLLLAFALSFLTEFLLIRTLGMASNLSFLLAPFGFFLWFYFFARGNTLYSRHLRNLTQKALSLEGAQREKFIRRRGGVSWLGPILIESLVALSILAPLLAAIFS